MGDAAYALLIQDPKSITGNFFIDDDVLKNAGITNLDQYACNIEFKDKLLPDGFVDKDPPEAFRKLRSSFIKNDPESKKVDFLFSVIQKSLNEELVSKTRAMYQFNLTGENSGSW